MNNWLYKHSNIIVGIYVAISFILIILMFISIIRLTNKLGELTKQISYDGGYNERENISE